MKCLRGCGAQMWYQDLRAHLLSCPCRLLVCGGVSDEFENDVVDAGKNGRSAEDLQELILDFGSDSDNSLTPDEDEGAVKGGATGGTGHDSDSDSDSDSDTEARPVRGKGLAIVAVGGGGAGSSAGAGAGTAKAPARRGRAPALAGNAKQPDLLAIEEENRLVSLMSVEEKFLYRIGNEMKRAKDKAAGSVPSHSLALCFKVQNTGHPVPGCVTCCVLVCLFASVFVMGRTGAHAGPEHVGADTDAGDPVHGSALDDTVPGGGETAATGSRVHQRCR
jgi:hypothetical protein